MADIDFTTSLNDKGFTLGLKNIERQAARTAKATESLFRLEVLKAGATVIGRSFTAPLRAAAETSFEAAAALRELDSVFNGFLASVGRDLVPMVRAGVSGLRSLLNWADQARGALVGVGVAMAEATFTSQTLEGAMTNQRMLRAAQAESARLDGLLAQLKQNKPAEAAMWDRTESGVERLRAAAERDIASSFDDQYRSLLRIGEIEDERLDRHRQLDKLMQGLTAGQREASGEAELRGKIDQAADAATAALMRTESKARGLREEKASAEAKAAAEAGRALDVEIERERLMVMRLNGEGRLADVLGRRLDLEERLRRIADDELITDEQKVRARRELLRLDAEAERLRGIEETRDYRRRMGLDFPGAALGGEALANAGISAQVFGPPVSRADSAPMAAAAAATAKNTARTAELLEEAIDRYIFGPRGATFQ
jgi:hypothetical protein